MPAKDHPTKSVYYVKQRKLATTGDAVTAFYNAQDAGADIISLRDVETLREEAVETLLAKTQDTRRHANQDGTPRDLGDVTGDHARLVTRVRENKRHDTSIICDESTF